ncbi:hypothetical protein MELA_02057 [Candidatus Methylomirabilis lanthanidiphila]|uniref:T6SS Phospholipase effector Tle1-like catalytic domain-containing protein n=1 Tax=Candidatus Methylomirabilis lanthanidiphila TaxID=2211376 RepID=A0A564ZLY5_9BACT|nr:DUF2235 domain-containing protein [Candidatus Methylomirabilis lanthanidiphila]VUZ85672.1 hypothetical protein MELA_02057 [Candidatus Methylomirabilis lanthanidiphila]
MANVRNLIIGCDGTWNDTDETALTNVAKLLNACTAKNQVTHYEEGVGTAHWEALPGGIYGKGLDRQILGAYHFLRKRFADTDWAREDNKVFIFGFSRGAYAARRLAGLIAQCGVPGKARDVERAWQLYLKRDALSIKELKKRGRLFDIPVEMLGVWDTVKTTTDDDFNDNDLPKCVVAGYHAMAIDEKRIFFPVLKWNTEIRVKQTWFPGVHSDVGGGYPKCGLSDIALQWMIDHACGHNLRFKASAVNALKKDPCGMLHDSYEGIWKTFGTCLRAIAKSETVHASTKERMLEVADYHPTNLPDEPNYET